MKNKIYGLILKPAAILLSILFININILSGQDSLSTEDYTVSISLKTVKNSDGTRTFTSKLTGEGEKGTFPVYQAQVNFYNEADGWMSLIGEGNTDLNGNVTLTLGNDVKYQKDKDGVIAIKSVFKGSGKLPAAEAMISFKDLNLSMNLTDKDSVRIISVIGYAIGADDEQIPLRETTVNVYVQGLFTKLKVGDCFLEEGEGEFTFPDNIPGDESGNTKIFVRLEEDENFGDVEKIETVKWGQHRSGFIEPSRSLWSAGAPLWMVITLTILLVGVWSHYLYAIIQLVKIRKEGTIFDKNL